MAARNWGSVFVVSLSVLTPFFLDLDSRHFSVSMIAYGRSLLLTESRFPFSTLRLNQSDLVQIKRVGLASRSHDTGVEVFIVRSVLVLTRYICNLDS